DGEREMWKEDEDLSLFLFSQKMKENANFGSTKFDAASVSGGGSRFVRGFHLAVVTFVDVVTAPSLSSFPFDITVVSSFCRCVVSVMLERISGLLI
ncbi:hypothetical protein A2U01_0007470, partial [Trifolium medium]|nr:hypothetical protein [Trifolium medium]